MRGPRYFVTVLWLLAMMPATMAQSAGKATPPTALLTPELQPIIAGVECDTPTDQAAIAACKVESVFNAEKRNVGWALRDGQGKLLRRFIDSNGDKRLDQWSYFQDGFEVYRQSDLDGDRRVDECRWLNAGGTRIAVVEGGKIKQWKKISAEEASKILVQALASGDLALLETVMATSDELTAAGVPKEVVAKVAASAEKRAASVEALQKTLVGWDKQTVWNRFDGTYPRVIPSDPTSRAGEGPHHLRKRHGDPGFRGRTAESRQARLSPDPRHHRAGRHLEVRRTTSRHRSREADRGDGQRHPLHALSTRQTTSSPATRSSMPRSKPWPITTSRMPPWSRAATRKRSRGTTSGEFRSCARL